MSLEAFFAERGLSRARVGFLTGIDGMLFVRVDQGRQPLPLDVADELALFFGVDRGTIAAAAGYVSTNLGPGGRTPLPPDPLQGDPLDDAPAVGQFIQFPATRPLPRLLLGGPGLVDGAEGCVFLERNTGQFGAQIETAAVGFQTLARVGSRFWCFGAGWATQFDELAVATLEFNTGMAAYTDTTGASYAELAGLWVASSIGGGSIHQVDLETGSPSQTVTYGISVQDVFALGELVYVTSGGSLLEVEAATGMTLRTALLRSPAAGIAHDGEGNLWVVNGGGLPGLWRVPLDTLLPVEVPLTGATPGNLRWVAWGPTSDGTGQLWVSEGTVNRLLRVAPTGAILEARTFPGAGPAGRVVPGLALTWYANGGDGTVHGLVSTSIAASCATYSAGGSARVILEI